MIREKLLEFSSIETMKNISHEKVTKNYIVLSIDNTKIKLKRKEREKNHISKLKP